MAVECECLFSATPLPEPARRGLQRAPHAPAAKIDTRPAQIRSGHAPAAAPRTQPAPVTALLVLLPLFVRSHPPPPCRRARYPRAAPPPPRRRRRRRRRSRCTAHPPPPDGRHRADPQPPHPDTPHHSRPHPALRTHVRPLEYPLGSAGALQYHAVRYSNVHGLGNAEDYCALLRLDCNRRGVGGGLRMAGRVATLRELELVTESRRRNDGL